MRYLALALVGFLPLVVTSAPEKKTPSPHAEALSLVFQTQEKRIAEVDSPDREAWWFDTLERQWVVQRPFGPGYIDSTHMFDVLYKIDGKVVAAWTVDTGAKTVQEKPEQNKRPEGTAAKAPPSNPSQGAAVPHP